MRKTLAILAALFAAFVLVAFTPSTHADAATIKPLPAALASHTLRTNYSIATIYSWRNIPWLTGSDCTTPGTITDIGTAVNLISTGAFANCAEIYTPFTISTASGVVEVKFRTMGNGHYKFVDWPAVWLSGSAWPVTGEIDAFEAIGGNNNVTYHYGTNNSSVSTSSKALKEASPNIKPGWNVVDIAMSHQQYQIYYNGKPFTTIKGSIVTNKPMTLLFDVTNMVKGVHTTMQIGYVRVFN